MALTQHRSAGKTGERAAPVRKPRRPASQGRLAALLLLPSAVVVFGIILYPIGRTVLISFFDVNSAVAGSTPFVGLHNYTAIFSDSDFWSSMGRTVYFTVLSTALELLFGLGLALLMEQKLRMRWLFRAVVVLPWALPTVVNGAMWRGVLNAQYGSLNALLTQLHLTSAYHSWLGTPTSALNMLVLADVWKTTPLVAFFLLTGLQSIPKEIYESARVDGAGPVRAFWSITAPLLIPSVSVVLVLRTIDAFKVFDLVYVLTGGGPANGTQTIAYYTYVQAFSDQRFGFGSALADVIVVCILLLCAVYLRALRRNETSLM
ncbi:carbohydrate ABC transporter permease [Streptacidiphilus sp. P02-A3a]|uniref:carbohydrate ABC transporter permease n=1 Tax=Streptacidiphilus sp. P02-A3a TaxID=2704468 RepID=UPI0015FAB283|nr:sugar ABC transporter permease [Streptacidiphilus sp. P02-A3a]QMU71350.1 sugar ABC transporter permease [Streptacidiphilus sp. P02-A3a]